MFSWSFGFRPSFSKGSWFLHKVAAVTTDWYLVHFSNDVTEVISLDQTDGRKRTKIWHWPNGFLVKTQLVNAWGCESVVTSIQCHTYAPPMSNISAYSEHVLSNMVHICLWSSKTLSLKKTSLSYQTSNWCFLSETVVLYQCWCILHSIQTAVVCWQIICLAIGGDRGRGVREGQDPHL